MHRLIAIIVVLASGVLALIGSSNVDPDHKFSWGENVGWMNWRDANGTVDGVMVEPDHLAGYIWGENIGWINVGNGGGPYANTDDTNFGVNVLATGDLEGFAWGENIGWINFDTSGNTPNQARYDSAAQRFRGYAWGENVGWINLDNTTHYVATLSTRCCLPSGACTVISESACRVARGKILSAGSVCLGDGNGDGIDDACAATVCEEFAPGPHWIDQGPGGTVAGPPAGTCAHSGEACSVDADCGCLCVGGDCSSCEPGNPDCLGLPVEFCIRVYGDPCSCACPGCLCVIPRFPDTVAACEPDICEIPAVPEDQDTVPSGAELGIDITGDCLADTYAVLGGPVTVHKHGPRDDAIRFPGLRAQDGHLDVIDTEMIAMSLTGGGITLVAGAGRGTIPLYASYGAVAELSNDPTQAVSLFDVFVELTDNSGGKHYNQSRMHVWTTVNCLPPKADYMHITGCTPLYTSPVPGQGTHTGNLVRANHFTFPDCCFNTSGFCQPNVPVGQCQAAGGKPVPTCLGDTDVPPNGRDEACEKSVPVDCGPDPATNGQTCKTVTCPETTEQCVPKVVGTIPSSSPPQHVVLECECDNPNLCHVGLGATGTVPTCVGTCPSPLVCQQFSQDTDGDGNPDRYTCDCVAAPPGDIVWNSDPLSPERTTRSLRFRVQAAATATGTPPQVAIKVTMIDLQNPNPPNLPQYPPPNFSAYESSSCTASDELNGCARWVGKPGTFIESQDNPGIGSYRASRLQCTPYYHDWVAETATNPIAVVGAEINPSSLYSVQTYGSSCKGSESGCANVSAPVTILTRRYGDVEQPFNPPATSDQPNAIDVTQLVNKFKNATGALVKSITQLQPNLPELNADINALDIVAVVDAVKQFAYPFSGPCPCPSTVTCGTTPCATPSVCVSTYGAGALCVKTCTGGANLGDPCINNTHCPGGSCSNGFCRDRCGRCKP